MKKLKYIELFESFSKLSNQVKEVLSKAVEELKNRTDDTSSVASMAVNPKDYAGSSRQGQHRLEGLGKPFAAIIPGSVDVEGKTVKAEIEHGVNYENNKKTRTVSCIEINKDDLTYTIKEKSTEL